MKSTAYLALGSNLGDREAQLEAAVSLLAAAPGHRLIAKSQWMENPPVEDAGPHMFLNGVIALETELSPHDLLSLASRVEEAVDPERSSRGRKLARKIDIDILLYDDLVLETEDLVIPHPRMREREFVMKPLEELLNVRIPTS